MYSYVWKCTLCQIRKCSVLKKHYTFATNLMKFWETIHVLRETMNLARYRYRLCEVRWMAWEGIGWISRGGSCGDGHSFSSFGRLSLSFLSSAAMVTRHTVIVDRYCVLVRVSSKKMWNIFRDSNQRTFFLVRGVALEIRKRSKWKKKCLFLFDYACHPCTGTMLIFSVYLSVCLMSQPEGWTHTNGKVKYIKS